VCVCAYTFDDQMRHTTIHIITEESATTRVEEVEEECCIKYETRADEKMLMSPE